MSHFPPEVTCLHFLLSTSTSSTLLKPHHAFLEYVLLVGLPSLLFKIAYSILQVTVGGVFSNLASNPSLALCGCLDQVQSPSPGLQGSSVLALCALSPPHP